MIVYLKCTQRSDATSHTEHETSGEIIDIEASNEYNGSRILEEKHHGPWKHYPETRKKVYRYSDLIINLSITQWFSGRSQYYNLKILDMLIIAKNNGNYP